MKPDNKTICYEALKNKILTLELAPGSPLDEIMISKEFQMSRTPFREILQRLAAEGYVVLEKHKGAIVSSMNFDMMRKFFQSAPMIYASISRLAAENANTTEIEELKLIQENYRRAVTDNIPNQMVLLNHSFHKLIGVMANNSYLDLTFDRLLIDHSRTSQIFYRPSRQKDEARITASCNQHDELITALEDGDADRAVGITLQHWDLSRSFTEIYVLPDPLPIDPAATPG